MRDKFVTLWDTCAQLHMNHVLTTLELTLLMVVLVKRNTSATMVNFVITMVTVGTHWYVRIQQDIFRRFRFLYFKVISSKFICLGQWCWNRNYWGNDHISWMSGLSFLWTWLQCVDIQSDMSIQHWKWCCWVEQQHPTLQRNDLWYWRTVGQKYCDGDHRGAQWNLSLPNDKKFQMQEWTGVLQFQVWAVRD